MRIRSRPARAAVPASLRGMGVLDALRPDVVPGARARTEHARDGEREHLLASGADGKDRPCQRATLEGHTVRVFTATLVLLSALVWIALARSLDGDDAEETDVVRQPDLPGLGAVRESAREILVNRFEWLA